MSNVNKIIWSDVHQKNYIRLYNKLIDKAPAFFKNRNKDTYLNNINKNEIIKFIKNLDLSDSSKETFFFVIARFYEVNKINDTFISTFKQQGYNLKKKREQTDGDNQLDEKEQKGYVKYNELVALVDNIKYSEITTRREHMKYLFLKLLLYNPLRTSFYYTAKFSNGATDDNQNYVVLFGKIKKMATLHIGRDKVSNTKKFNNNEDLKNIAITDNNLIDLIYKSLSKYPRDYLIEVEQNKPVTDNTILKFLRELTGNQLINIDMVRSAYITHHYTAKNLTFNDKSDLANRMRHSTTTANLRYYKHLETDPNNKTDTQLINKNNELEAQNVQLKKQLEEANEKLKKYEEILNKSKEPSKKTINETKLKEDPAILRKKRIDYIYKLNVRKLKKPNELLLKLYGIKLNEATGKYE